MFVLRPVQRGLGPLGLLEVTVSPTYILYQSLVQPWEVMSSRRKDLFRNALVHDCILPHGAVLVYVLGG